MQMDFGLLVLAYRPCTRNPVNCPAVICLPRMAILSSFGRETSPVNIMGPRSIFPTLFTPAIYFLLYFLFSCYHYLLGPGVSICKTHYNTIIWRAENRTHLSKQTRPSTERSRKASNVRGIPSRPDDPLKWVLIVRTQV